MTRLLILIGVVVSLITLNADAQTEAALDAGTETSIEDQIGNVSIENDDQLPRSELNKQHHEQIKEILSSEDFGQKKSVTRWRWIDTEDKSSREEKVPEWLITIIEFFERLDGPVQSFSTFLEVLLWITVALIIAFFLIKYRSNIQHWATQLKQKDQKPAMPTTLFGLDIKKESLPKNIPASANNLWNQGLRRQAIALLLQGSLVRLIHDHNVKLFDSDTENECCDQIDKQAPKIEAQFMRDLVSAWQAIAYAHRQPSDEKFTCLSQRWQEVFDAE